MARYILGERAARWIRQGMSETGGSGATNGQKIIQDSRVRPFTLRWSTDQGGIHTGEYLGCWIIYLPEWSLSIQGKYVEIDQESMEEAGWVPAFGYPANWWQIPHVEKDDEDLWLNVNAFGDFTFENKPQLHARSSYHIARMSFDVDTGEVRVDQIVDDPIDVPAPTCFNIHAYEDEESEAKKFVVQNAVYRVGGRTFKAENLDEMDWPSGNSIICAEIDISGDVQEEQRLSIKFYDDWADLAEAERDAEKFVIPLYKVTDGTVDLDLRTAAICPIMEF